MSDTQAVGRIVEIAGQAGKAFCPHNGVSRSSKKEMDASPRILSIGDDENLRRSRELILRSRGYAVTSISSNDFLKTGSAGSFDVAVISQSVTHARAERVSEVLRKELPEARILRIQPAPAHAGDYYDLDCEACSDPSVFLDAVKTLCARPRVLPEIM